MRPVFSARQTAATSDLVDAGVDPGDGRERSHDEEEHDEDESDHDPIVPNEHDQHKSRIYVA